MLNNRRHLEFKQHEIKWGMLAVLSQIQLNYTTKMTNLILHSSSLEFKLYKHLKLPSKANQVTVTCSCRYKFLSRQVLPVTLWPHFPKTANKTHKTQYVTLPCDKAKLNSWLQWQRKKQSSSFVWATAKYSQVCMGKHPTGVLWASPQSSSGNSWWFGHRTSGWGPWWQA